MRLIESADGTIKVVELDPTKWYWMIIEEGDRRHHHHDTLPRRDGVILVKDAGMSITFVESPDRVTHLKDVDNVGARPLATD